jgi:hypothetical protein
LRGLGEIFMVLGKWSRYRPVADSTTSTRPRPSALRGTSFTPVTRPPSSHTGLHAQQPQRLRFEQALVAHGFHRPQRHGQLFGRLAGEAAVLGDQLLGASLPAAQACWVGTREGSKP